MKPLVFPDSRSPTPSRRLSAAWRRAAVLGLAAAAAVPAWAVPGEADVPPVWLELRSQAVAYEHGQQGLAKDGQRAADLYCQAAKLGDPESQFNLGWMYAHGRGVPRDDRLAAFFFRSAADQGIAQAQRMLALVGEPADEVPACLRDPEPVAAAEPEPAPVQPPAPINAPKPIAELVKKMAPGFRVDPRLVLAIIKAESNFDPLAVSPKNAMGLMQLIPDTAARFNVGDPFDVKQNLRGGMAYLRWLLAYFEGDLALVAAAYNAGEGTVERYRGVPPFGETQAYVARVLKSVGALVHPFDAKVTAPSPRLGKTRLAVAKD